jgi:hypothetical protein
MWTEEPRTRRLIKSIQKGTIERVTLVGIPADFIGFVANTKGARRKLAALQARYERGIDRALGMPFIEACADRARKDEITNVLFTTPDVAQALIAEGF